MFEEVIIYGTFRNRFTLKKVPLLMRKLSYVLPHDLLMHLHIHLLFDHRVISTKLFY